MLFDTILIILLFLLIALCLSIRKKLNSINSLKTSLDYIENKIDTLKK